MEPNPEILTIGPLTRANHLIMAHGAGAPMTSPFLTSIAELLNKSQITVHRFEFPYMRKQSITGRRGPPPHIETLKESYLKVIQTCKDKLPSSAHLFIGGKSMGGRVATLVATRPEVKNNIEGVILLGYPFHPPHKPESLRTKSLIECLKPILVVQGTRDPFGTKQEVLQYRLPKTLKLFWIDDGNHDLKPRASSGRTHQDTLQETANTIASFMTSHSQSTSLKK